MAAIDFPIPSFVGEVYTFNGSVWTWNGYAWILGPSIGPTGTTGATGPTGPTGNTGATGPGVTYLSSTSTGVIVTGTTSNTFSKALLVPANSYKAEDAPQVDIRMIRSGTTSNSFTSRLYWNTTPDIAGNPILLATAAAVPTGNFFQQLSRVLCIISATNSTAIQNATITTATDYGTTTLAQTLTTIDWTQIGYLVVSIQLSSSTDSVSCRLIKIN